jgi:two-component system, cell cycle sensor histidine kinase and response regulator CckA
VSAFHPEAKKEALYAAIGVSDTGVGMDRETVERVFEPFFTTKRQDEDTGLGLTMTYSIVTQHGGFIDIDSEPGKGSVITIYLPLMEGTGSPPVS